jgi:hypothetical protein
VVTETHLYRKILILWLGDVFFNEVARARGLVDYFSRYGAANDTLDEPALISIKDKELARHRGPINFGSRSGT